MGIFDGTGRMVYRPAGLRQAFRPAGRLLRVAVWLIAAGLIAALVRPALAADAVADRLRERVEQLRAGREVRIEGQLIAARNVMAALYERRGFRTAWGLEQARSLLSLVEASVDHGLEPADYHVDALRTLLAPERAEARTLADRELIFTDALVRIAYHLRFGKANPRELYAAWNFSRSLGAIEPVQALESLLASDRLDESVERYAPQVALYRDLRAALGRYRQIERAGGWPTVPAGAKLEVGMRDDRIRTLRSRLIASGDLAHESAEPDRFDDDVAAAVKRFQARHGLDADGVVGARTLEALNIDVARRIERIRVNLERLRWVAQDLAGDYLLVDIAGFSARLYLGGQIAWSSRIVVGRPFRRTPEFRATMQQIVLNPTWTVPPTILREDLLPKLAKDTGYLAQNQMQVVDRTGRAVDPSAIGWERYRAGSGFPYQIVQAPGPTNPLGQLKFMLPNAHTVFLHDTPTRSLFERTQRAYSSGCIRLERPHELALLLLDDADRWSAEALRAAIAEGATRAVPVKRRVPVMLLYFTAEANGEAVVHFRPDLYDRDAAVLAALRTPFRFSPVDRTAPTAAPQRSNFDATQRGRSPGG